MIFCCFAVKFRMKKCVNLYFLKKSLKSSPHSISLFYAYLSSTFIISILSERIFLTSLDCHRSDCVTSRIYDAEYCQSLWAASDSSRMRRYSHAHRTDSPLPVPPWGYPPYSPEFLFSLSGRSRDRVSYVTDLVSSIFLPEFLICSGIALVPRSMASHDRDFWILYGTPLLSLDWSLYNSTSYGESDPHHARDQYRTWLHGQY